MKRQAIKITPFAKNVYTKIPITNSRASLPAPHPGAGHAGGEAQYNRDLDPRAGARGRRGPGPGCPVRRLRLRRPDRRHRGRPRALMRACQPLLKGQPKAELLWASTREVLNIFQAEACGVAIITVPTTSCPRRPSFWARTLPSCRSTRSRSSRRTPRSAASSSDAAAGAVSLSAWGPSACSRASARDEGRSAPTLGTCAVLADALRSCGFPVLHGTVQVGLLHVPNLVSRRGTLPCS